MNSRKEEIGKLVLRMTQNQAGTLERRTTALNDALVRAGTPPTGSRRAQQVALEAAYDWFLEEIRGTLFARGTEGLTTFLAKNPNLISIVYTQEFQRDLNRVQIAWSQFIPTFDIVEYAILGYNLSQDREAWEYKGHERQ